MNQNKSQNKEQTNCLGKCAHKISTWWHKTNIPPETRNLFKMLSSAFGCFAIALFLLALFTFEPANNILLLRLSCISLLLSILLLVAVFISKHCQAFYTCAKILDESFVFFWIFMLTPLAALQRIIVVLNDIHEKTALRQYLPTISATLAVSGAFFMAYLAAYLWLSFRSAKERLPDKSAPLLLQMAFTMLFFVWLLMILSNVWPLVFPVKMYGYVIWLIITTILLGFYMKKSSIRRAIISSALAFVVIAVVVVTIIWLLAVNPNWLWFCFGLLTIAAILLGIGMKSVGAVNKSHVG